VLTRTPVLIHPQVLVNRARGKFDAQGRLEDKDTRDHIRALLEGFEEEAAFEPDLGGGEPIEPNFALEDTAVLAQEMEKTLLAHGLAGEYLRTPRDFVEQLSVATEARISTDSRGASALHDVTEGGVATTLWELSLSSGNRIRVDLERISIHPLTRSICTLGKEKPQLKLSAGPCPG